jgi:hypothetical protein
MALDWAACVAILVIDYHQPLDTAWNATYREFCLLNDVKHKLRTMEKRTTTFDRDRVVGLEAHLKSIGVL